MRFSLSFLATACCLWAQAPMHLTLAQAQQQALQNNPRFSSAKLIALAAHQVAPEYRAAKMPTLNGAVTAVGADNGTRLAAGALNNPVVYSRFGSGLIAGLMLTDFGRTSNLIQMANLRAQAQDQTAEAARADILLAGSLAYFAVQRAKAVQGVADQTVKARQLVSDQVTALAQSQLRSDLEVSFANVNLQDAKLLQVQALNDVQSAEAQLADVLGLPGGTTFDLSEEAMPGALPPSADDLVRQAVQNRPELKDLRLQQSAAERFTRAEHDLYYPTVGVLGSTGLAPAAVANVADKYGAVGVNVNIPIFNGGLFKARQTEAELRAQAAAKNVADEENRVTRDVRVAYLDATTTFQRIGLTQQLLEQAAKADQLAETRYQLGLGTIVELSQAQLNLTSAQIANAAARYDYQSRRVAVDYQSGVLR
jgi:outer membrane protein